MNRTIRAILAVVFVFAITFSAIVILQNVGKSVRFDVTDRKLYTLSQGTKNILGKLDQPLKVKLYYSRKASLDAPDQIKPFVTYQTYVRALLQEYQTLANGMIELEIIDPRPFSDDETQAMKYQLKRFKISETESFFFGMVVQTQFGVEKVIDFFSPDRQQFVEYDISYLIDSAVTRQKKRIGVLSSLPIMGADNMNPYLAKMMIQQGQTPKVAWVLVEQLKGIYDIRKIADDVHSIPELDVLMVIHPKGFSQQTLFAIDQYVLRGGKAIIFVDPYSIADAPDPRAMGMPHQSNSSINELLNAWGLDMPDNTFAGDTAIAGSSQIKRGGPPVKIISYLGLTSDSGCFGTESAISAELNAVNIFFAGVLNKTTPEGMEGVEYTPLLKTSLTGKPWLISSPQELAQPVPDYPMFLQRYADAPAVDQGVVMGYLINGKLKSAFPDGIEIPVEDEIETRDDTGATAEFKTEKVNGLTEAKTDCAVAVFSDVDFISDLIAYQKHPVFGVMANGDNNSLVLNAIEDMSGSSDLIAIRSRGKFRRPFTVVDQIELEAEKEVAVEEKVIDEKIEGFNKQLTDMIVELQSKKGVIGSMILQDKQRLELEIRKAEVQKKKIRFNQSESIEALGVKLRNFCTLPGPIITLLIAIFLDIRRSVLRKRSAAKIIE